MKIKSLLLCFALITSCVSFWSCNEKDEDIIFKTDAPKMFSIENPAENAMFEFKCQDRTWEGTKVTAKLTVLEQYKDYLPAFTITTTQGELVEYTEEKSESDKGIVYTYTFIMPNDNIVLAVEVSGDKTEYTIETPAEDKMYLLECVDKARKNETVTATLKIAEEYKDYLPALTIKTEKGESVKYTEKQQEAEEGAVYTYTFTMPGANIAIDVKLNENNTEFSIGQLPKDERYLFECVDKAKYNETITAKLTILSGFEKYEPTFTLTTQSGKTVAYTETSEFGELGHTYIYEFKMPNEDVTPEVALNAERRVISTDLQNVYLWIMNCYDRENPQITSAEAGWSVGFHFNTELGYEYTEDVPEVTGDISGDIQYTYWNPEAMLNGYTYHHPCWTFEMPGEPATIKVYATEKTTYADKDFIGEYKGYQIAAGENQMITGASTLDLNLKANTSYIVKSTDMNNFDFRGEYIMDESTNRLTYNEERIYDPSIDNQDISMFSHAIRGQVLEDGDIFFIAENLVENSSSNYRYYYASKEDVTYTCAARDEFSTYCLLEVTKGTTTQYYFFDSYNGTLKEAQVTFTSGTTIGGDAVALISVDGVVIYKYTHTTGNAPKFIGDDGVKGTYTGANGDLILDGFGGATIGGQTGTYVLKNNNTLAVVTIGDVETTYVINVSAKTYSVFDPNAWTGPTRFYATTTGTVGGAPSDARITVFIGTDLQGKATPGLGGIIAEVENGTSSYYSIISATSAYEYDAAAKTITFTNMLTKTDPAQSGIRNPVTFTVSDDLQTLTSTHETLYKYNSTSNTINLDGVEIKADVPIE